MENESRRRLIAAGRECIRRGATRASVPTGATNIDDLADELLELVLLRVSSPLSLVRAAAACKPWRRVIAADGFLGRFRSLHGPFVLGHFYAGADTAFVPAPTPPGEDATAGDVGSHVSLGFLRNFATTSDLFLTDCHGGLLAFVRWDPKDIVSSRWTRDPSVVVCDPSTRQHRVVPWPTPGQALVCLGAFLLDAEEAGTMPHMSNFRLLRAYLVRDTQNIVRIYAQVSMFSAKEDRWVLLASPIDNVVNVATFISGPNTSKVCVGRAKGSLFWSFRGRYVIHVDESTGGLSSFLIPFSPYWSGFNWDTYDRWKLRVVDNDAREVRVVRIVGEENLEVFRLVHGREVCEEEKRFNLSLLCNVKAGPDISWHFLELSESVEPGCVMLSPSKNYTWMFSIDVESVEVKRVEKRNWHARPLIPYELTWPPKIKACL